MHEHGPVDLLEHVATHLYCVVRPHPKDVRVECAMMEAAQRHAVRHDWFTMGMPVRQDMRGVEQLLVPEATDRAVFSICGEYAEAERFLVHSLSHLAGHIPAPRGCFGVVWPRILLREPAFVHCYGKCQVGWVVAGLPGLVTGSFPW